MGDKAAVVYKEAAAAKISSIASKAKPITVGGYLYPKIEIVRLWLLHLQSAEVPVPESHI